MWCALRKGTQSRNNTKIYFWKSHYMLHKSSMEPGTFLFSNFVSLSAECLIITKKIVNILILKYWVQQTFSNSLQTKNENKKEKFHQIFIFTSSDNLIFRNIKNGGGGEEWSSIGFPTNRTQLSIKVPILLKYWNVPIKEIQLQKIKIMPQRCKLW